MTRAQKAKLKKEGYKTIKGKGCAALKGMSLMVTPEEMRGAKIGVKCFGHFYRIQNQLLTR